MQNLFLHAVLALTVSVATAQKAKPTFSNEPLSADSTAIYQDVLAHYFDGDKHFKINLSRYTSQFPSGIGSSHDSCTADFDLSKGAGVISHDLAKSPSFGQDYVLVDPKKQKVEDPGEAIRRGKPVEDAVSAGFASALFTLSEVVYSKDGTLAAVQYGFHCGSLCGNGGTLVFQRTASGAWTRSNRRCSQWVS